MVGYLALVIPLDVCVCHAQLLLHNLRLYSQVRQFVAQPLSFNSQPLTLLLANPELLLQHDTPLDGHIVLGFDIFERGRLVTGLTLVFVALHFNVSEPELERPL